MENSLSFISYARFKTSLKHVSFIQNKKKLNEFKIKQT